MAAAVNERVSGAGEARSTPVGQGMLREGMRGVPPGAEAVSILDIPGKHWHPANGTMALPCCRSIWRHLPQTGAPCTRSRPVTVR